MPKAPRGCVGRVFSPLHRRRGLVRGLCPSPEIFLTFGLPDGYLRRYSVVCPLANQLFTYFTGLKCGKGGPTIFKNSRLDKVVMYRELQADVRSKFIQLKPRLFIYVYIYIMIWIMRSLDLHSDNIITTTTIA